MHKFAVIEPVEDIVLRSLKASWESSAPLKVQVFLWLLLQDRIPTRVNLMRRGVLSVVEDTCTCCSNSPESVSHLFLLSTT